MKEQKEKEKTIPKFDEDKEKKALKNLLKKKQKKLKILIGKLILNYLMKKNYITQKKKKN